jgi:hypothetical protein
MALLDDPYRAEAVFESRVVFVPFPKSFHRSGGGYLAKGNCFNFNAHLIDGP